MAPSDAHPTARAGVDDTRTAATRIAALPAHPKESVIPAKTKHQNIHVAPAVLDAARKDDEALLRDLRTSLAGLTQTEAEERARAPRISSNLCLRAVRPLR
jgi:hypothetical protein